MVKDAEAHASEDEERKKNVEARNTLDSLIYQVEKDTAEWGDKVGDVEKTRLEEAVEMAKEALKFDDAGKMNEARDELMQAFSAAGQKVYQDQGAEVENNGATVDEGATSGAEEEEDVVEADFEIVDDEKG